MKNLFLILLSISLTFGCSKVNNDNNENNYLQTRVSNVNPCDFVGVDHNLSLDYLATNVDILNQDQTESVSIILEYYTNNYPEITFYNTEEMISFLDSNYIEGESILDVANILYNQGEMSDLQYEYFSKLDSISREPKTNYFNELINLLEEELEQDDRFTNDEEKEWLWGAISVCYHSRNYWYEARTNEDHLWHQLIALETEESKEQEYTGTWIGECWADTVGFVRGFFRKKHSQPRLHNASNGASNTTNQYISYHTVDP